MNQTVLPPENPTPPPGHYVVGNFSKGTTSTTVSSQWASRPADQRFLSLGDLRDTTRLIHDQSRAEIIAARLLRAVAPSPETREDLTRLALSTPSGGIVSPTHWSFGQTARLIGAPAGYLRELPSQITADAMNWGFRHAREDALKLYIREDGNSELRAMTSPTYGRIPDYEVVEALMKIAGNGTGDTRWKVPGMMRWQKSGAGFLYNPDEPISLETTTIYGSDRDIFVFLVDDKHPIEVGFLQDGSPDLMFRGIIVWNSEVGSRTLKIMTFYMRAVCCNRILWGVEGMEEITIRHTKMAVERFMTEAAPALEKFADGGTVKLIDAVHAAKAAKVANDDEEALAWLRGRNLNKSQAEATMRWVKDNEGHPARSIWDFAQGVTGIAHKIDHQDERIDLEAKAGSWLDKIKAA